MRENHQWEELKDILLILSSGCSVQIGTNSTALTSMGSPEPGGAAYMASEACLQPVHLDIRSKHEGGSC